MTVELPMVSAVVGVGRGERTRVTGRLLGRMVRVGGDAVAGEVEVLEPGAEGLRPSGRVTLVPVKDLEPLNEAAKLAMEDRGDKRAA